MQALAGEHPALQHAKAVLFVDDRQRQRAKLHLLLHQRVRPDDQTAFAALDRRQQRPPLGRGDPAAQQRDAMARRCEPSRQGREMLLRKDLGGRHESDLESVFHGDERREHRDNRLAGADVALQQPLHRPGFCRSATISASACR